MTDTTPNLALPEIAAAQAQKHVTHNEALRVLDAVVHLAVLDRDLVAPPDTPAEGQRWLVGAPASGDWTGHDGDIAAWQDAGWQFYAPHVGWLAYVMDEAALVAWSGSAWEPALDLLGGATELQNMALLGIGTTADETNPLSAKLNNALWMARAAAEGGDGDLRYKLSKEAEANTLSLLFQDNFSGRAEIGLTGDDDFHFKVSPDGVTWHDAIVIDKADGGVSFPNTSLSPGFQVFTTSGTFSKASLPGHVTHIVVHVVGGGGGGGGGRSGGSPARGIGGGGGGYARKRIAVSSLADDETVTIGDGGASGATSASPTNGGNGGTTSFGAHVSATGGSGGIAANGGALGGASGGNGSGGDLNILGESSSVNPTGTTSSVSTGGNAAAGYGTGGKANVQESGHDYGGGGSCNNHTGTATSTGAAGLCVVEW